MLRHAQGSNALILRVLCSLFFPSVGCGCYRFSEYAVKYEVKEHGTKSLERKTTTYPVSCQLSIMKAAGAMVVTEGQSAKQNKTLSGLW